MAASSPTSLVVRPIGFVRSPFSDKADAPRQATAEAARDVSARVELLAGFEDALVDLEGFDRIWLLFWFDRAEGWRPKVLPPRSETKRGLFATRAPHRPNPIGMSCVRLERVEGLVLHVRDIDLIDMTPVLDIKPYIRYADAFPDASGGWLDGLDRDPRLAFVVERTPDAEAALAWLAENGVDLWPRIEKSLALGPQPHAYRRIKETSDPERRVLAVKEWRVLFRTTDRVISVERIASGYRPKELAKQPLHQAFSERFGVLP